VLGSLVRLFVVCLGAGGLVPMATAGGAGPAAGVTLPAAALESLAPSRALQSQPLTSTIGHDMPSWSPDGSRIAFVGFRGGRLGDIFTVAPDGRGERRLTATPEHEDMPKWSPDGSKIAFVRHTGGAAIDFHIFVMNPDGTGQTQITHDGAPNYAPAWSPDGSKIVFVSQRNRHSQIFVMNADGTEQTLLTEQMTAATGQLVANDSPDWSPSGERIAFASNRTAVGAWRLFTMRPDGSDVRPLTQNPTPWHNERRPAWSPDGSKVAYVSGPGRDIPVTNSEIYVVDADGGNERRLTRSDEADTSPSWAPNGARLAITREFGRLRPEVYTIPAALGPATKITGGTMRLARFAATPARPRAGRLFTVNLSVTPGLTGVRRLADVACHAAVGNTLLQVRLGTVVQGRLRCTWLVPRQHKGKRLLYMAGVMFGHVQVSRTVSAPIG
jgi:Tol biopolymer transport system component